MKIISKTLYSYLFSFYPWILPTLTFAIMVIVGSTMHPLWGDEAETALFARNILRYGIPKGWDGVNIMGLNNGIVLNEHLINYISPWLQYYLVAVSFWLFGESSFTARLPFIVLSILTMPLFYYLSYLITKNRRIALLALWLLSLCIPFILFSYQARYYSITVFTGLLFSIAVFRLTQQTLFPKVLFAISGILFFYAHYISFIAFYISIFLAYISYLLTKRASLPQIRKFLYLFCIHSIILLVACIPWYLLLKPESGSNLSLSSIKDIPFRFIVSFAGALYGHNLNNLLPLAFIPLFSVILYRQRKQKEVLIFLLLPFLYLTLMAVFNTVIESYELTVIRYATVIFPFSLLLCAYILYKIWQLKKWVAVVLLGAFVFTNLFTLYKPRSFLLEFMHEAINPYPTPDKMVANYLQAHAKAGDTAFITLDRNHEPLIFHLHDKIRFVNRISPNHPRIFPKNRIIIPQYIYDFRDNPDWIILYGKQGNDRSFFTFDYRPLPKNIDLHRQYKEITLPIFFSDMSRPEISHHSFLEIKPSKNAQVFIYKKLAIYN